MNKLEQMNPKEIKYYIHTEGEEGATTHYMNTNTKI